LIGIYGISGRDCSDHSGLMLAARITLPHFSVSAAMSVAKSAVEPESTEPLRSVNRALILGSASAALISLLSLSMISAGVFLGATTPYQLLASYPGTKSDMVGTSGNASERVAVVTANERSLPALMCPIDSGKTSNTTCT